MAALFTPWAWRSPTSNQGVSSLSRPRSAPAAAAADCAASVDASTTEDSIGIHHGGRRHHPDKATTPRLPLTRVASLSCSEEDAKSCCHVRRWAQRGNSSVGEESSKQEETGRREDTTSAYLDFRCLRPLESCTMSLTGCDGATLSDNGPMSLTSNDGEAVGWQGDVILATTSPWLSSVSLRYREESGEHLESTGTAAGDQKSRGRRRGKDADQVSSVDYRPGNTTTAATTTSHQGGSAGSTTELTRTGQRSPRVSSCTSTQSPPLVTTTRIHPSVRVGEPPMMLWHDRELTAARRALRRRPQRQEICRTFSTRGGAAAGMTAAQRALRGPYVMSRMGHARSRRYWRPVEVESATMGVATRNKHMPREGSRMYLGRTVGSAAKIVN